MPLKIPRRRFLKFASAVIAAPAAARRAYALDYPTRPVRLIVGFPPGGVADLIARLIAQWLSQRLGQSFVVDNRSGAASNLAAETVVRAAPDGYTLLAMASVNAWNTAIYDTLDFDFVRDIAPVASIMRTGGVMEVNPTVPAKTVPEFIAYAKANPGKINMASAGPGSGPGLYGELFKTMAGVDLVTVNYHGSGPALPDLLSGRDQVMFDVVASSIGYIKAGQLRPLGVTTASRVEVLPDVPPIGDFVPGYEASGWNGIGAPAKTPPEIIEILNRAVNAALADAAFKARLAELGTEPFANSPAAFGKYIVDYTAKWAKVIHAAGIKAD
jgi:tripartite-type tricarboxylate transporter receptor subunit TctC